MRPELILLKLFLEKELYDTYRNYVDIGNNTEQELKQLYDLLDKAYETYHRTISFNEYYVFVLSNVVGNQHTIKVILDRLETWEVGHDIAEGLLKQLKEKNDATEIAKLAIRVTEGTASFDLLASRIKECNSDEPSSNFQTEFVTTDLQELYTNSVQRQGLRWRLGSLNKILGSLRQGDFGFIFARPETGKTTFLASEGTYFASQLAEDAGPGIWINNEEDGKKVVIRQYQAALDVTRFELFSNIEKYKDLYDQIIRGKLQLVDNAAIHRRDIEKYCEKYKPSFFIFDQIDKIRGFEGDREDLKLGSIYQWSREIAKSYCPVIAVTQADGTGEGKKWLTMENVANAKTAKQAEADWILGIGATHAEGFEYVRHLHASKNKLAGDEDSDPSMRHGKVDVIIDPDRARYRDYE